MIEDVKLEEVKEDGTKVTINPNNDSNKINILTTFDSVMDIDLMILMMIQNEYNNPDIIDQDTMHLSLHDIKQKLVNRTDECPVTVCMKNKRDALSIYTEIMNTKYQELLDKYSNPTGIMYLMSVFVRNNNKVTILCRNKEEANLISKYDKKLPTIVYNDYAAVDCSDYTIMFLKSKNDVYRFKQQLINKHVFVSGYKFNLSFIEGYEPVPDLEVSRSLYPFSRLGFVNVYKKEDNIKLIITKSDIKKKPKNN